MIHSLSEAWIRDYRLPDGVIRERWHDADTAGLYLMVGRATKVFVCRYREGIRKIDKRIGRWPRCTLANARRESVKIISARDARTEVARASNRVPRRARVGHVYAVLIGAEQVKVGWTGNMDNRLSTYRTPGPFSELIGYWEGTYAMEQSLLKILPGRIGSSEVFRGNPAVIVKMISDAIP